MSSVFRNFFRIFFGIFSDLRKTFLRSTFLRDSFDIISYLISNVKRFSQLFSDFFRNFFVPLHPGSAALSLARQLVHYIIADYGCQAFFATFFGFFLKLLIRSGCASPHRRQLAYFTTPKERSQPFLRTFSHFFALFFGFFSARFSPTRCCVFARVVLQYACNCFDVQEDGRA